MIAYAIRRLATTIPVMGVVALFVFSLLYLTPGDPAALIAGDQAGPEDIARIRATLGLDRPFPVQFGDWCWRILHGDLGTSIFTHLPVAHLIGQRLEPTLSLLLLTLVIAVVVAVPIGVVAAWRHGSAVGPARHGSLGPWGFSLPVFVVGYLLAYVFALQLRWVPVQGFTPVSAGLGPFLANLILPAVSLALLYIALIARITRSTMLEALAQDYVRTARAKGVGQVPRPVRPRAEERRRAGGHRDRLRLRGADQRRRGDGKRLRHPRHRSARHPTRSCAAITRSSRAWCCSSRASTC